MECNKDEAVRAKEIAEKKFAANDFSGAKKFAMKAYTLYPDLEGIQNMISTLDVYHSAERKIKSETDWYGVLGVDPRADDETIRKQFKKIILKIHPDKNRFNGANGAFKLVHESWNILSDKARRLSYDLRRGIPTQKVPPPPPKSKGTSKNGASTSSTKNVPKKNNPKSKNVPPSSSSSSSPFPSPSQFPSPSRKNEFNVPKNKPSPPPHPTSPMKTSSFWTVCQHCKMQHEYLRVYLNLILLCPYCQKGFSAIEITVSDNQKKHYHQQGSTSAAVGDESSNFQWGQFSGPSDEAVEAMIANAYEQVSIRREEAEAAARKKPDAKRRKGGDN